MKKWIIRLIALGVVVGGAWYGYSAFQQMPQRQETVASAKVRQGDVVVKSYARGELRAVRSATLIAPNLFGTVQVTRLAAIGALAREKDLVVEFDDAEVRSRLEEKELEIEQLDEQFKKSEADLAIRTNQDQVDLLNAQYAVRRADLEVKRNELLSEIDRKKNLLTLDETKRRLKQLESDIKSKREQAEAELAVLREKKQKALLEMAREKARLNQVKLLSPMSGLVAVRANNSNRFGFGFAVPDIREGDQVQPGMPVADVLDLSELEVIARVGELDRANLNENQEVRISLDAIPDKQFKGHIKSMSSMASANIMSSDPAKKFDVLFSIDMRALLEALGAKPDQVAKILAQAEANRKKPSVGGGMGILAMMGGRGGAPGGMPGGAPGGMPGGMPGADAGGAPGGMPGGMPGGAPGADGAAPAGGGGGRRGGGGGAPGFGFTPPGGTGGAAGGMSDADRQKMRDAMTKALNGKNIQDLSPEERQKVMAQAMAQAGGAAGGGRRPDSKKADGAKPEGGEPASGGRGGGRRGGGGGPDMAAMAMVGAGGGGAGRFTAKDLENAKLPPAPEEDDQLEVLLRPGLLTDVEITVERIPDAVHVPVQAVFEKEGKSVVYVKNGAKWEERVVKPAKRSESTLVIASGLKKDEIIALADPFEKKGKGKNKDKDKGGNAMGGLPGGK